MADKESPWLAAVRKAIGARADIMTWRQHAGTYCPPSDPKIMIKVAPDGIADIMGVQIRKVMVTETLQPGGFQPHERIVPFFYGQAIAIETKATKGTQLVSQKKFQRAWESQGGIYLKLKPGDWLTLWQAIGTNEQVDQACVEHAGLLWHALTRELELEKVDDDKPIQQVRRKRRKRRLTGASAVVA